MNRRVLLAGLAVPLVGGTAAVAQRLDYRRKKEFSVRTEPPITGHRFELVDAHDRFGDGSYDPDERFAHRAEVEFDTVGKQVGVLGRVKSGSRSCKETKLKSLRYDESADTLTVVVFDDYTHQDICMLEIAIVPYTVSVDFESNLPSKIIAKHVKDGSGVVYEETFHK
ncbi:hypothetical protein [Haladaptatus cibarius]|uniref:hypothetical protein n=1 Tax=Haladaptatus cibarius TaxID=453847 RepID=UPI00067913A4|nr:hypothetical protein [Haladaptatus cibarius]